MNNVAKIYRAEILRAVLGPRASELKAVDITRLNQIADRLADAEAAEAALQARGYGRGAVSFVAAVAEVPTNTPVLLKRMFAPRTPVCYPLAAPGLKP